MSTTKEIKETAKETSNEASKDEHKPNKKILDDGFTHLTGVAAVLHGKIEFKTNRTRFKL